MPHSIAQSSLQRKYLVRSGHVDFVLFVDLLARHGELVHNGSLVVVGASLLPLPRHDMFSVSEEEGCILRAYSEMADLALPNKDKLHTRSCAGCRMVKGKAQEHGAKKSRPTLMDSMGSLGSRLELGCA
jgi:hypothetical protein